jgi:ArsR family transcriptional regulator
MTHIRELFESLADENRLRIINLLIASPFLCVADFQRVLEIPQTRVSRHLAYLKSRDIVHADRKGTWMYYRLSDPFQKNHGLIAALRGMFAQTQTGLHDIELLLEGLDENAIAALREATPETVECVIENCCTMGQ